MGVRDQAATEVSSAEVSRNFGAWQDRAIDGPVVVTRHGRPRVVIVSAATYATANIDSAGSNDLVARQRLETSLGALLNHMSEGFVSFDADLHITAVNRVYEDMSGSCAAQLIGRQIEDYFPSMRAIFPEQLRRTLRTGEPADFETASSLVPGRIYHIQTFPYPGGVAALFTSSAEDSEMKTALDEASAVRAAIDAIMPLPVVSLNVRGVFTACNASFTALTGFTIENLAGARLADIVRPAQRHAAHDAIDSSLSSGKTNTLDTTILAKGSVEKAVRIGMSPLSRDDRASGLIATLIAV